MAEHTRVLPGFVPGVHALVRGILASQPTLTPLRGTNRDFCRIEVKIGEGLLELLAYDEHAEVLCSIPGGSRVEIDAKMTDEVRAMPDGRNLLVGAWEVAGSRRIRSRQHDNILIEP